MDISELPREFEIHPDVLKTTLDGAAGVLRASRENVRPANKKALRGAAKALAETIERVSGDEVRARLVGAAIQKPDGPDEDGLAHHIAWCEARTRVAGAIDGARDLLALVHAGKAVELPAGRPPYEHWTVAIGSILDDWIYDLGREVTISGHAADPRDVKPSQAVRFVHQCMQLLGEDVTEQACRTILQNLRNQKDERPWMMP